jgi:hypothetical protein
MRRIIAIARWLAVAAFLCFAAVPAAHAGGGDMGGHDSGGMGGQGSGGHDGAEKPSTDSGANH